MYKLKTGENFVGLGALQIATERGGSNWMLADVGEESHIRETVALEIDWGYTDFRKDNNYTTLTLKLPFVGEIDLNPLDFAESDIVYVRTDVNVYTGEITYTIFPEDINESVATVHANCAYDVPFSSITSGDVKTMVADATMGVAVGTLAAASIPAPVGLASVVAASTHYLFGTNQHKSHTTGSYSGSNAEYAYKDYSLTVRYHPTVSEPSDFTDLYGRPCMKVLPLSNLTGYVETVGFSIAVEAIAEVRDLINSAMDRGVYIE